ncbi:hypothetical protein BDZ94DRAFT_1252871 [Collybia nuda]|uniref:Uncharacterized protein n=1 Tax=Collybia nuda TaxID=64659 RepID=A0A9P5YD42_9AGAR|nr:hypothetical protein BDZ94DRAFT_1252871 [Collybia nuda]
MGRRIATWLTLGVTIIIPSGVNDEEYPQKYWLSLDLQPIEYSKEAEENGIEFELKQFGEPFLFVAFSRRFGS